MNKFLMVLSLIGVFFSINVFGQDQDEVFQSDGKKIVVTGSSISTGNNKYHADDFKKGIYVAVNNGVGLSADNRMSNVEFEITKILKSKGFKISNEIDKSDAVFLFSSMGSLSIVDANNSVENSGLPNKSQITSVGGQIINGVLTGGVIPGLVGAAAVLIYNPDSKLSFNGIIIKDPKVNQGFFGKTGFGSKVNKFEEASLSVSYKLEKNNEAPANIVLEMAVDQWIKKFVVNDTVDTKIAKTELVKPVEVVQPQAQ